MSNNGNKQVIIAWYCGAIYHMKQLHIQM